MMIDFGYFQILSFRYFCRCISMYINVYLFLKMALSNSFFFQSFICFEHIITLAIFSDRMKA